MPGAPPRQAGNTTVAAIGRFDWIGISIETPFRWNSPLSALSNSESMSESGQFSSLPAMTLVAELNQKAILIRELGFVPPTKESSSHSKIKNRHSSIHPSSHGLHPHITRRQALPHPGLPQPLRVNSQAQIPRPRTPLGFCHLRRAGQHRPDAQMPQSPRHQPGLTLPTALADGNLWRHLLRSTCEESFSVLSGFASCNTNTSCKHWFCASPTT